MTVAFLCFVPLITFNALVDPYYDTGFITKEGFNKIKTESVYSGGRIWIGNAIVHDQPEFVVIGTSKTGVGMPRNIKEFNGLSYLNISVGASNIYELSKIIDYLIHNNQNLKSVLFTLDFLTFSSRRKVRGDFYQSSINGRNSPIDKISRLLSYECFKLSQRTMRNNYEQNFSIMQNGSRSKFENFFDKNFFLNAESYAYFDYCEDRVNLFKKSISKLLNKKIDLKLMISPTHCVQYIGYKHLGIWHEFLKWKKHLTKIVNSLSKSHSSLALFDFSTHNERTMSSISINEREMIWFRDSTHYTPAYGDDILKILYKRNSSKSRLHQILKVSTIDQYIAASKLAQSEYERRNPTEVEWVKDMYFRTQDLRISNIKSYERAQNKSSPYELIWQ